jgi:hypothetical protein
MLAARLGKMASLGKDDEAWSDREMQQGPPYRERLVEAVESQVRLS